MGYPVFPLASFTGLVPALDQLELVVFSAIRADIDEANSEYQRDVENGKKGGSIPKEKTGKGG